MDIEGGDYVSYGQDPDQKIAESRDGERAADRCYRESTSTSLEAENSFQVWGEKKVEELRNLVEVMAKALVDFADQVNVAEVEGEQTTVIEIKVAKEDLGKIIGKEGRTARSLRTILAAVSTKLKKRSVLEILE